MCPRLPGTHLSGQSDGVDGVDGVGSTIKSIADKANVLISS